MSPFNKGPVTYQIERWEPSQRHWTRVASGVRDTNYQLTGLPFDQDHLFRIRAEAEKVLSEPTYPISFNRFRCKANFYVLIMINIHVEGFVGKNFWISNLFWSDFKNDHQFWLVFVFSTISIPSGSPTVVWCGTWCSEVVLVTTAKRKRGGSTYLATQIPSGVAWTSVTWLAISGTWHTRH